MKTSNRYSVLIVEDDPDVRKLISVVLERDGLEVDQAIDGEDALAKIASHSYDLIVLDIMLPLHNGFEVYDRIQMLAPRPRVIVTSAIARYVGDRFGSETIVLQKPFTNEALSEAIERSL